MGWSFYNSSGQLLTAPASTASADLATEATNVTVTQNDSESASLYPVFVDGLSSTQGIETDSGLTYNPSSGLLTAAGFSGPITGNLTGTLQTAVQAGITTVGTIDTGVWEGTTVAVDQGGTGATTLNNLITLGTHTTGNYAATVADGGAGGITVANSGSESAAITVQLDVSGLTTDTLASGDFIAFSDEDEANDVTNKLTVDNLMETGLPLVTEDTVAVATDYMVFLDGGATGNTNKESIADFVSGIAGTNVTASSGQLSVGAAGAGLGLVIALS